MAVSVPIYTGQDFYVPSFEVRLDDRPLGTDVIRDITQVTYRDKLDDIDGFDITINNWDADRRALKYVDDDLFDPGKRVSISMGYYGRNPLALMVRGEIVSLKPSFPSSGQPTLAITGLNLLHRLRTRQESKTYTDVTDKDIAEQIAQRLNVTASADQADGERYPYLIQDNQYDIVFLMNRARRIGFDLFVEETPSGSVLHFEPSTNVRDVAYSLKYGTSLIQFQPTLAAGLQVQKVTVRSWDTVRKQPIRATADRGQLRTRGVGAREDAELARAFQNREEVITTHPVQSEDEARTLALQTLERIAKGMLTGSGATVGLPDLRTGTVLDIDGLGSRFSGRYFVTATTHTIGDSGYTTQFECRREEL